MCAFDVGLLLFNYLLENHKTFQSNHSNKWLFVFFGAFRGECLSAIARRLSLCVTKNYSDIENYAV